LLKFLGLLIMANWQQHFDAWHKISKADLGPVAEDGGVLAGRDAEDLLQRLVEENYSFRGCHSFAGKRVPNLDGRGRREIDLIVVTSKRMYIIECKNWTGNLIAEGDRWVQTNPNVKGPVVRREHEDVLQTNQLKMKLLMANLRNQAIPIKPETICQKVIFMNPKLRICSPAIAEHPDVITPERLETYLSSQDSKLKLHEQLFSAVIGVLLDDETKNKVLDGVGIELVGGGKHEKLLKYLRELGTWDRVFLRGTKIISGDVRTRSSTNIFMDSISLDRVKSIRVRYVQSKWLGFFKALFRMGRPIALDLYDAKGKLIEKVAGNPHGVVRMIAAGSPTEQDIDLCQIDRITYGRYVDEDAPRVKHRQPRSRHPKPYRRKSGFPFVPLLLIGAIGSLMVPAIRNPLVATFTSWQQGNKKSQTGIDKYSGEYDFGKYSVKIYRQNNKLWADTAVGKAELKPSGNPHEFKIISGRQGALGNYIFSLDQQGKVIDLLWVQKNGQQRRCPKVQR
jgi:Nuclease-related domain